MEPMWVWIVLFTLAGVLSGFHRNYKLANKIKELEEKNDIHNNLILNHEKAIVEINGLKIDIGGLFILYTKLLGRIIDVEKHNGIYTETAEDSKLNELNNTPNVN